MFQGYFDNSQLVNTKIVKILVSKIHFHKEPKCIEKAVDYWGKDLKKVKTTSADVCACQCKDYYKCQYFTWNVKDNICSLKDSNQTRRPHYEYMYAGSKNCCKGISGYEINYKSNGPPPHA